jgi:hypothetical protein
VPGAQVRKEILVRAAVVCVFANDHRIRYSQMVSFIECELYYNKNELIVKKQKHCGFRGAASW